MASALNSSRPIGSFWSCSDPADVQFHLARPGHHGAALSWVRNGVWASVLAGATAAAGPPAIRR
jgi:hypothetical protein